MTIEEIFSDGLVTTSEVCTFLKIGKTKAYELIVSGDLPSTMIGSSRRVPKRALIDFAAARYVDHAEVEGSGRRDG